MVQLGLLIFLSSLEVQKVCHALQVAFPLSILCVMLQYPLLQAVQS